MVMISAIGVVGGSALLVAAVVILTQGSEELWHRADFYDTIVQLVSYVALIPVLLWTIRRASKVSLTQLGVAFPSIRKVLLPVFLLTLGFAVIYAAIYTAMQYLAGAHTQAAVTDLRAASGHSEFGIVAACVVILGPVCEELFFRGLIFNAFYARSSFTVAAVASALLFAAYHLDWYVFPTIFIAGIWFAWLYAKYKSIWATALSHALLNLIAAFVALH